MIIYRRIQEQGLRTFLFTYSAHYTTLSLSLLARTFSLPLRTVTSIVSKMIWTEELSASLDQSGGVVVLHRVEVSRAQQLALVITDKVNAMVEQNEKTLDIKMGGSGGWGDRADGAKGEKRGEQTQERRGRGERTRGGTRGQYHSKATNSISLTSTQVLRAVVVGADLHKALETECRPVSLRYVYYYFMHSSSSSHMFGSKLCSVRIQRFYKKRDNNTKTKHDNR